MALFVQNFRSKIFRSSTDRKGIVLDNIHLGKSEVCESEVADVIDKNVFRF